MLQYFPGIKAKIIEDLLHNLNLQEGYKQKEKFRLSSTKTFTKSVEKFIQEECAKIARHREVFPAQKVNIYYQNLKFDLNLFIH